MMNQTLIHQHGVTGREHSEAAIGWILMRFLRLMWPSQLRFGCGFAALCSLWLKNPIPIAGSWCGHSYSQEM